LTACAAKMKRLLEPEDVLHAQITDAYRHTVPQRRLEFPRSHRIANQRRELLVGRSFYLDVSYASIWFYTESERNGALDSRPHEIHRVVWDRYVRQSQRCVQVGVRWSRKGALKHLLLECRAIDVQRRSHRRSIRSAALQIDQQGHGGQIPNHWQSGRQWLGNSSSIRLAGCVGSRANTSFR